QAYFSGETGLRSSLLLKAGESPFHAAGTPAPLAYSDMVNAAVDPNDDTGIWVVHEYPFLVSNPNIRNWTYWVANLYGSGCAHSVFATGPARPSNYDTLVRH